MDKISENLDKIFAMDQERIKKKEAEVKAQIAAIKKSKAEREKLVKEWGKLSELRKTDLVEFKKAQVDYDEKAEAAIEENKKLDADLTRGKIDWAEHKAQRRQPEEIRKEFREKFWKDWSMTLDAARSRHVEVLRLEANIARIDSSIIRRQDSIYIFEEELVKKKLDDMKRFHPGWSRALSASSEAEKRNRDLNLAEGKPVGDYRFDIRSAEDLLQLPLDSRFKKEHLNMVFAVISKYRDFDFSSADWFQLNYLSYRDYSREPTIDVQVHYSEYSKQKDPNRGVIKIEEKIKM